MNRVARRFCVPTVGRAGSTSLMDRLERYPDIAVPNKNIAISCPQSKTPEQLIDCFLRYVVRSHAQLSRVPNAIALAYEDLCDPGYSSRKLT